MNTQNDTTPAIYVGTYHKYISGSIAGGWLELDNFIDKQEFLAACIKLHKDENSPELMFQDREGVPETFIGESYIEDAFWEFLEADWDQGTKIAFIELHGSWDARGYAWWVTTLFRLWGF